MKRINPWIVYTLGTLSVIFVAWIAYDPTLLAQGLGEPRVMPATEVTAKINKTLTDREGVWATGEMDITRDAAGQTVMEYTFVNYVDPNDPSNRLSPQARVSRMELGDGTVRWAALNGSQAGPGSDQPIPLLGPDGKPLGRMKAIYGLNQTLTHCDGAVKRTQSGIDTFGPTQYEMVVLGEEGYTQRFVDVWRAPRLNCFKVAQIVLVKRNEEGAEFEIIERRVLHSASRSVTAELLQP